MQAAEPDCAEMPAAKVQSCLPAEKGALLSFGRKFSQIMLYTFCKSDGS